MRNKLVDLLSRIEALEAKGQKKKSKGKKKPAPKKKGSSK